MASYEQSNVQNTVSAPAIALLVTGILGIIIMIGYAGYFFVMVPSQRQVMQKAMKDEFDKQQAQGKLDPVQAQQAQQQADVVMGYIDMMTGTMGVVNVIVGLVCSILVILGAIRMKNLQSYGLAMTSAILALIPCTSPCCILGVPFGIWALVVLSKPEVKAAFR
jgi:hypothetical protein